MDLDTGNVHVLQLLSKVVNKAQEGVFHTKLFLFFDEKL